jgi:hypothetical protein
MAARGRRIGRVCQFFRETDIDEARVALTIVKEIMEARMGGNTTKIKDKVIRKKRRTKAQMEAQRVMETEAPGMAASA